MSRKIIFVTAPEWCPSCRVMEPIIKQVASILGLTLEVVDADDKPAIVASLGVTSLPTTILMENDMELTRIMGAYPVSKILTKLENP